MSRLTAEMLPQIRRAHDEAIEAEPEDSLARLFDRAPDGHVVTWRVA